MKKILLCLFVLFIMPELFSEPEFTDEQIKKILVEDKIFGNQIIFNADNTYSFNHMYFGERADGKGTYQIKDNLISFTKKEGSSYFWTDYNGSLDLNYIYAFIPDRYNNEHIGCLAAIDDEECVLYSEKQIPEDMIIMLEGVKVNKVYKNIRIKENLKMRDSNSLRGNVVTIKGCDFDIYATHYVEEPRKVVFKGMVITPIAKTVVKDTIDGITAPWYYIKQVEHDPLGRNEGREYYVWIFGGYVEEYPNMGGVSDLKEIKAAVESIGLKYH